MKREVVIWGGTGNFKVLCELLGWEHRVVGYFDNDPAIAKAYGDIPLLGGDEALPAWVARHGTALPSFIVSIGHAKARWRVAIHDRLKSLGLEPLTAIHRTAFVAGNASIGEGGQVYARAAVCVDAVVHRCCIINTGASVDHESILEEGVTVGPGAIITGQVHVGPYADIYSGAVVLPRLRIGEGAVVGAGAVVRHDVEPYTLVAGNPARTIRSLAP